MERHDNCATDTSGRILGVGVAMNAFREKLLSIGVISKRTRSTVIEGREHPDSGLRFKATTDEMNNTVTEHSERGATAVSARQDVEIRPKTVKKTSDDSVR